MKKFKFFLSACLAALVFTSCSQDEELQVNSTRMKTIEITLENAKFSPTRGLAGNKISSGDPVKVNDFKVFLLDHAGKEYSAKVSNGSADAQTYWSNEDLAGGALDMEFHYVDAGCSKIVAVANLGKDMSYEEFLQSQTLNIDNEQNQDELSLYAEAELVKKGNEQHNDVNVNGGVVVSDVYEANLVLKPRISRFEVDGFRVAFNATPKYQEIQFTDILFDHYVPTSSLLTGVESTTRTEHLAELTNQTVVYNWFNNTSKPAAWYWDATPGVKVTPTAPAAAVTPLAYHTFSGSVIPRLVMKLIVDGQPAYIYSKGFYSTEKLTNGQPTLLTELEEGKIYRMSAQGVVDGSDGFIPVDEDDIDPMDRCLEITVDVEDWVVELVYPEF